MQSDSISDRSMNQPDSLLHKKYRGKAIVLEHVAPATGEKSTLQPTIQLSITKIPSAYKSLLYDFHNAACGEVRLKNGFRTLSGVINTACRVTQLSMRPLCGDFIYAGNSLVCSPAVRRIAVGYHLNCLLTGG